nr:GNAT family N-acetyltransferase [Roseibium sp. RKSG952]
MLAALSTEVWLDTYARDGVSRAFANHVLSEYAPEVFQAALHAPDTRLLVLERQAHLLGYVRLHLTPDPPAPDCGTAEIKTLYLRRHHHRLGLGTLLFRAAMAELHGLGHCRGYLTVYEHNDPAVAFYRALGMDQTGRCVFRFEDQSAPNLIFSSSTAGFSGPELHTGAANIQ